MDAIPRETALQLCAEIRGTGGGKWYRLARIQCWGCMTYAKGDPEKMCISSKPGHRGCNLVNERYARRTGG